MLVSCVHPVAILRAVFCTICSLSKTTVVECGFFFESRCVWVDCLCSGCVGCCAFCLICDA